MSIDNMLSEIRNFIDLKSGEIIELNDYLYEHPELSEQEYETSRIFAEKLKSYGFDVEYPFMGLPTAFMAKKRGNNVSEELPRVILMAEYDALPDVGHACGHNLHGTMAMYAGIALSRLLDRVDGEVWIVGTPAEETDGAKVLMAEKGVFDNADLALMFHSYAVESYTDYRALALDGYEFCFDGKAAHAAASPWLGISAQSGMMLFMDAINMLRLHIKDMCRIHALVISVSGATNIIPDKAVCRVEARAACRTTLNEMMDAVFCCASGAAAATRTNVSWSKFMRSFDDMLPNLAAEKLAEDVLLKYGVVCTHNHCPTGSTDVGNVSYRCPAIQPEYAITKKNLSLHTREFAAATISDEGHEALLTSILALSEICLKVLTNDILRKEIKREFLGRREKSE